MKSVDMSKAGMEDLDVDRINEIIYQTSKGSKYFQNEKRKGAILKKIIAEKLSKLHLLTSENKSLGEKEADKILKDYQSRRDLSHFIVHVDMDAFYAAVETRDHPEFRLKPLAVGSSKMLCTSNYIARRFGVRAAMPGFIGKKLCPNLIIVPPDFIKYTEVSHRVRSVLSKYTHSPSSLIAVSLDEAYVDITNHLKDRPNMPISQRQCWPQTPDGSRQLVCRCGKSVHCNASELMDIDAQALNDTLLLSHETASLTESKVDVTSEVISADRYLATCRHCGLLCERGCRTFGISANDAVREMRFKIFCETSLTCSAGIGANSLIAKIACTFAKPNGQYEVESTARGIETFISNVPIRKVPGIGHVTDCQLQAFGVQIVKDLYSNRGILYHLVSRTSLTYLMRISLGVCEDDWTSESTSDSSFVLPSANRKSISIERTFDDCSDSSLLISRCQQLCSELAIDMKEAHVQGRTVTLKMKLNTFEVRSRSQTLPDYTCSVNIIAPCALDLLKDEIRINSQDANRHRYLTLRLLGVKVSNLMPMEMYTQVRQITLDSAFRQGFQEMGLENKNNQLTKSIETSNMDLTEKIAINSILSLNCPDESVSDVICPVCLRRLQLNNLDDMNSHLDNCLNRQAVIDAVKETLIFQPPACKRPLDSRSFSGPIDKFLKLD